LESSNGKYTCGWALAAVITIPELFGTDLYQVKVAQGKSSANSQIRKSSQCVFMEKIIDQINSGFIAILFLSAGISFFCRALILTLWWFLKVIIGFRDSWVMSENENESMSLPTHSPFSLTETPLPLG